MSAKKEPKKEEAKDEPKEGAEGAELTDEAIAAAKKKKKKKMIIIGAAAIILIGGGVGAALTMGGGEEKPAAKGEHGKEEAPKEGGEHGAAPAEGAVDEHGKPIGGPAFVDLPNIVVNLASDTNRTHFVSLDLALELSSEADAALVESNMPRIIDGLNSYLRDIRREDLDGSAGMDRIEQEIMLRLEKILPKGKVKDILFKKIIVQ